MRPAMSPFFRLSLLLAVSALALGARAESPEESPEKWRSSLFPSDWHPAYTDAEGRFLHDFSSAGYKGGLVAPPDIVGPIFDVVRDFQADSTGLADAHPAIQRAIQAAESAGGGVVYLPAGLYRTEKPLLVGRSGVVIRGEDRDRSRIHFTGQEAKNASVILIQGSARTGPEVFLAADAAPLVGHLSLADAGALAPGQDIDLGWFITDEFIADHGMAGVWSPHRDKWQAFFRLTVVSVDTTVTPHRVEVDVPPRYAALVRDGASLRPRPGYIQECGVEHLGLSDVPLAASPPPTDARRHLIQFQHAKNSWVRDVASFSPDAGRHEFYDKGIFINVSKHITIADCVLRRPERRDAGRGYIFELGGSNDILIKDCVALEGRHNFTSNWLFGSVGNVFLRCTSRGGALADWNNALGPSDFHHSLAIANLVDSCTIDDGWEGMNRGTMSGGAGHTVTQSVFWNCRGAGYVRSAQYGWGYLIGLAASLDVVTQVDLTAPLNWWQKQFEGTAPWDFVEGPGRGDHLDPASLYEAQRALRLSR